MKKMPGKCVHCGCTDENPCHFGHFRVPCTWLLTGESNNGRFVCSDRDCHQKEVEYLFAQIEEKQRKAESVLCP